MTNKDIKPARLPSGNQLLFAYGCLSKGMPCGFQNAMLKGFVRQHKGYASCKEAPTEHLYGKVVEVDEITLARFDTWADLTCLNYHRFIAEIQIIDGPVLGGIWVYQLVEHAQPAQLQLSSNGGLREEAPLSTINPT